jgi:hypothetical protein
VEEETATADHADRMQHQTALKTYNRDGNHKRTNDGASSNAEKKKTKSDSITPLQDTSTQGTGEFTMDTTGTGSAIRPCSLN